MRDIFSFSVTKTNGFFLPFLCVHDKQTNASILNPLLQQQQRGKFRLSALGGGRGGRNGRGGGLSFTNGRTALQCLFSCAGKEPVLKLLLIPDNFAGARHKIDISEELSFSALLFASVLPCLSPGSETVDVGPKGTPEDLEKLLGAQTAIKQPTRFPGAKDS